MTSTIHSAIDAFRSVFPLIKVYQDPDDQSLRYEVRQEHMIPYLVGEANRIIIEQNLPVEVEVSRWARAKDGVFKTAIIEIRLVKEAEFIEER